MQDHSKETGLERLQRTVRVLEYCRLDWVDQFSATDLLKIVDAHLRAGWDVFPDSWSRRQLREAISHGTPAAFREDYSGRLIPVYAGKYHVEMERRGSSYKCRIWRGPELLAESYERDDPKSALTEAYGWLGRLRWSRKQRGENPYSMEKAL